LIVYPDTSFLFSHYLPDIHSQNTDGLLLQRPTLLVTPFHSAELANAIFQWVFRGILSRTAAQAVYGAFEADCSMGAFRVVMQPEKTYSLSIELAQRRVATLGARTLDTLHVAAALELGATQFWTFDQRQARLAEAEGLQVN
jgi:predicted nucleic acid-binding protein